MVARNLSSREFNQNTAGAKRFAQDGPVYITDRGEPSHVLLTFADYQRMSSDKQSIAQLLAHPPEAADIDFIVPKSGEPAQPATFG